MQCALRIAPLVGSCLLVACDGSDPSYDTSLRILAAELRVNAEVLGTSDPPTARRLRIILEPGPRATLDQEHLCPIVHATATVNGVRLEQTSGGEHFPGGCDPILYELELTDELLADLQQEPTHIEVRDSSGAVEIDARALLSPPIASFLTPASAQLRPGEEVELSIEPSPEALPYALMGDYTADDPPRSFGLGQIVPTEQGLSFTVLDSAMPSNGVIRIEGAGFGNPFRGIVDRCDGAETCILKRVSCDAIHDCRSSYAYGPGFDKLELAASVVSP
jgi:hypothetical protein